jgi:phosphoglycolate phosphatase
MAKLVAGNKVVECTLVIFDKNGTLVDQHLLLLELARARKRSVENHAGQKAAELWEKNVGVDLKNGKIDHSGPLARAPRREELLIAASAFYLNGFSWADSRQLAQKAYDDADNSMKPPYGSVLLEGVAETVRQLRQSGLKLAVASTDTHKRTVESFRTLGLALFFDAVVGSDDVVNGKPSPDMIIEILKKTESKSYETIIVGDSAEDMRMGRNAGLKACIGVLTGFTSRQKLEQLTDVVIASVAELHVL